MFWHSTKKIVLSCGLIGLQILPLQAENRAEDIAQLLVQGHFWYERGRVDLAEKSWRKVLRAEPDNPEANSGINELLRYDPETIDRNQLRLARELAKKQRYLEALQAYRLAFAGKKPPTGYYANEYFETLGGQEAGRDEAIAGLRSLVTLYPSNPRFQLSLARLLTYNEATRREAIEILSQLKHVSELDEDLVQKALEARREALLWLNATRDDIPLFEQMLERVGDDPELIKVLAELKKPTPKTETQQAFQWLDDGQPKKARNAFREILKTAPEDVDALSGAGISNLRLKNFWRARKQLKQAIQLAPEREAELKDALRDASYWADFKAAERALKQGQLHIAHTSTTRLLRRRPNQAEGLLLMGNIQVAQLNYSQASDYFEQILQRYPQHQPAQQALIGTLINRGDDARALELLERFNLPAETYTDARNQIRSSQLQTQAATAETDQAALDFLEQAEQLTPQDTWLLLKLARLYRNQQKHLDAQNLLQRIEALSAYNMDAAYAVASFHAEAKNWPAAQAAMEKISDKDMPPEYQQFKWNLWAKQRLTLARDAIAAEQPLQAEQIANELASERKRTAEIPLIEAELLLDLQKHAAAKQLAEQYKPPMAPGFENLQLRYATILLRSNRSDELEQLLAYLSNQIRRQSPYFKALQSLQLGQALQHANAALKQQDDTARSYQIIAPWLSAYPKDSAILLVLAEIASRSQHHEEALRLYQQCLKQEPGNLNAVAGIYGEALTLGQFQLAADSIDAALQLHPESPRLLTKMANLKLRQGDRRGARLDLERAIQLAEAERPEVQISALLGRLQSLSDPDWLQQARHQHARLQQQEQSLFSTAVGLRHRGSAEGLDLLDQIAIPLQVEFSRANGDRVQLKATYTELDNGRLASDDRNQFGSFRVSPTASTDPVHNEASGIALSAGYQHRNWQFQLGTTPHDFLLSNVTAAIDWKRPAFDNSLHLFARREAVKDSLLSYAGAVDPASGKTWGGVSRAGAGAHYTRSLGTTDLSLQAAFWQLSGDGVADNHAEDLQTQINWPVLKSARQNLTAGIRFQYLNFAKNLSDFTLGQGGYFSPQDYFALSFPITYTQKLNQFHYKIKAEIGIQQYRGSASDVFPNDPGLQAILTSQTSINPDNGSQNSQTQSTSGVYTFRGEFGYSLDRRLIIGGWAVNNNSNNFNEVKGGAFLKYYWDPIHNTQPVALLTMTTQEVW